MLQMHSDVNINKTKRRDSAQGGYILPVVLITVMLLCAAAMMLAYVSRVEVASAGTGNDKSVATSLAQEGLQWAERQIINNSSYTGTNQIIIDGGKINTSVTQLATRLVSIVSTGTKNSATVTRQIAKTYQGNLGNLACYAADSLIVKPNATITGTSPRYGDVASGGSITGGGTISNGILFPNSLLNSHNASDLAPGSASVIDLFNQSSYSTALNSWDPVGTQVNGKYIINGPVTITKKLSGQGTVFVNGDVTIAAKTQLRDGMDVAIIATGSITVQNNLAPKGPYKLLLVSGGDMNIYESLSGIFVSFGTLTVGNGVNPITLTNSDSVTEGDVVPVAGNRSELKLFVPQQK